MRAAQLLLIAVALLALPGCSGMTIKEPVFMPDGSVATYKTWTGRTKPIYAKQKLSRTAVISKYSNQAKVAVANTTRDKASLCAGILEKDPNTAAGQAEQFRSFSDCVQSQSNVAMIGKALGRPDGEIEAISQNESQQQESVQRGLTDRFRIGKETFTGSVPWLAAASVLRSNSRSIERVGTEAARTGNVTTGDIINNTGNAATESGSNDAMASSGELGTGTATGSGTASTTGNGGDVNLTLGNHNRGAQARDDGNNQVDTFATQNLAESANGLVNNNSNIDQQPNIDSASGLEFNNNPLNGANNSQSTSEEDSTE